MSNANSVSLAYVAEATYGVIPSGPPTLQALEFTSESFKRNAVYKKSQLIRSDRQVPGTILVDANGDGGFSTEFRYGALDDFLKAAIQSSAWSSPNTDTITCSLASGDNSINRASGDFTSDGYAAGQWIRVSGFSTNGAIFYCKIVTAAALKLTVTGITLTNESATSVELEGGAYITNGTTQPSFYIERQFTDLTNKFSQHTGQVVNTLSLGVSVENIVTVDIGMLGKPEAAATATAGTGSNTAASTNPIMNAVTNVDAVLENGSEFSIRSLTLTVSNNLRERKEVATLGATSIGAGSLSVTGNITLYYGDSAHSVYAKYLADTVTKLAIRFIDNSGNAYVIDLPTMKYTQANRNATAIDTDVEIPLTFEATLDATELKTMRVVRWAV